MAGKENIMSVVNKRKKWTIIVGIIIVIIMIIAMSDKGKEGGEEGGKDGMEIAHENDDKREFSEKIYNIKDVVSVGDVDYTVNSVQATKQIGNDYLKKEAQNMYYIVDVTIKNNGNEAFTVSSSFFKLKNGEKEYSTDTEGAMYIDNNIIYDEINPEASLNGQIVFDISQETIDAKGLQLQVQSGVFGTEKQLIQLNEK